MTTELPQKIVWPEVFAQLPWVTRLKDTYSCTGFMAKTPLKAVSGSRKMSHEEWLRLQVKYSCKNSARWQFTGLKPGPRSLFRINHSGIYCWSHLLSRGIFADMEEEARTLKWFKKHDPAIYQRLAPRTSKDIVL